MEEGIQYWEVNYVSCEGNKRWTILRCPEEWGYDEVEDKFMNSDGSSSGDDPAQFVSAEWTSDDDFSHDYT